MLSRNGIRLSVLTVAALVGIAVASPAALGQGRDGDSFDVDTNDDVVTVRVGSDWPAVERGAEAGTTSNGCDWSIYVNDDLSEPMFANRVDVVDDSSPIHVDDPDYSPHRLFSETGRWFQAVGCDDLAVTGVYAEGDAISLPELVGEAWSTLDPPRPDDFGTSPPHDDPDRFAVVRIPTWFWVDEPYRSTTFTTRANFPATGTPRVWAEANARPETSEWSPGDGSGWFGCPALGTVHTSGMGEDATDCAHTYTRSSVLDGDGSYTTQARVWFETWWESSLGGSQTGPLPPLNRESLPVQIEVGEIQSVER